MKWPVSLSAVALCEDRRKITAELDKLVPQDGGVVGRAMRYAVLGEGQRLRPLLALRVARALDGDEALALRAGLAVELLHAASLAVDDLPCMDDAVMRRGQPAVHRAFGEAAALLAAFGLVSLAARTVVSGQAPDGALGRLLEFQLRLLATLDCSALIAGQAADLGLEAGDNRPDRQALASLKTAPLFELAARAGLLAATTDPQTEAELVEFGRDFGIAFQLTDDYLDGDLATPEPALDLLKRARRHLEGFGRRAQGLFELLEYLDVRIFENDRRYR
jgi:geranylgeranyl diphosphate synthase type II